MGNVLVTDATWHKTLAVVRDMGGAGLEVGAVGGSRCSTDFFSRYCKRRVVCPDPVQEPAGFLNCLIRHVSRYPYDLIIPMDDVTIGLVARARDRFPAGTRMVIAPWESLDKALDKAKTFQVAQRLSVPAPKTWFIEDLADLKIVADKISGPLVVKPRKSWGARGVSFVWKPKELEQKYLAVHQRYPYPLIQEMIPMDGPFLAVGLLFDQAGEPVAGFVQRSLREFPVTGGSSTLRESISDPLLLAQAISLLREIGWVGLAQVEFKIDPRNGQPKLMEINPRCWNSIQLAIEAGVNFPLLLYKVAMGIPFEPVFDYAVGVRSRWLIPGDILHFLTNSKRFSMEPSFFAFFDKRTVYEDFPRDDLKGVLGMILSTAVHSLNREMWRFVFKRHL
jgi:predicted ATP-grasp superfamily ATP-dependent carboligase